jgi:hypothetical protein
VFANALREENFLRDECHVVTELRCLQQIENKNERIEN